uniref:Phorbol-ester/DAG-type domain-containing protein n=1 Tax=Panagrolaimus sp. PS1159 TaxID=55785 RepID=A0AC35FK83_9BILA
MKSLIDAAKEHGNPHRLILQLVMAQGGIRTSKMADVFQRICQACSLDTEITEDCTPDAICDALIESINPVLQPLDLTVGISRNFSLQDESYFVMLQDIDSYIFSARAVKELEPILRTSNYELWTCLICKNLVIVRRFSHHCHVCGTVMHNTCLNKMITLSNTAVACPGEALSGGRCINRFGVETLDSMVFDKAAPETISRPIEIVGVRGGTQILEDEDEEEATAEDMEEEENDVDKSASKTDKCSRKKSLNYMGLEESDQEGDDEEMVQGNNIEDNAEQENAQDSARNELETNEQYGEEMTKGGEDLDEGGGEDEDEQMGELEEIFAEHNIEDTFALTSSNQEKPVKAKKKIQSSAAKKSGDALDELFAEMEEEEEEDDNDEDDNDEDDNDEDDNDEDDNDEDDNDDDDDAEE